MSVNEGQQDSDEHNRSLHVGYPEYLPVDGLPPFCIEDIFSNSRSLSPIELDRMSTEATCGETEELSSNDEEMTIEDLNYAISTCVTADLPPKGLDTIYEGVSLSTTPRLVRPVTFSPFLKTGVNEAISSQNIMPRDLRTDGNFSSRFCNEGSYERSPPYFTASSNTQSAIVDDGPNGNCVDNVKISCEIQMVVDTAHQMSDTSEESDLQLRIARCNMNDSLSNI